MACSSASKSLWWSSAAAVLAVALAVPLPAVAASSASSAVSDSFSTSVGSISTSFNASSDASSPGRPLNAGAYRITEVAEAPGRAGYARLTLRAEPGQATGPATAERASKEDAVLFLPLAAVANAALAVGQVIHARARPYGLELAKALPSEAGEVGATAFFLVVADDVYRELQTRPVKL